MRREQCRAARALLDWSIQDLADHASVGTNTIQKFEVGTRTPRAGTIKLLRIAFEQAGVEFLGNGKGPGVRLIEHAPTQVEPPAGDE